MSEKNIAHIDICNKWYLQNLYYEYCIGSLHSIFSVSYVKQVRKKSPLLYIYTTSTTITLQRVL